MKDEDIFSRGTTFIHHQLTLAVSLATSIAWRDNVRHSVAAYLYLSRLSVRSSEMYSHLILLAPLINRSLSVWAFSNTTYSLHSLYNYQINIYSILSVPHLSSINSLLFPILNFHQAKSLRWRRHGLPCPLSSFQKRKYFFRRIISSPHTDQHSRNSSYHIV